MDLDALLPAFGAETDAAKPRLKLKADASTAAPKQIPFGAAV